AQVAGTHDGVIGGEFRQAVRGRRDDDVLVVAASRAFSVGPEQIEVEERLFDGNFIPRVDMQGGNVEPMLAGDEAEWLPPRIARRVRYPIFVIGGWPAHHFHHVNDRENAPGRGVVNFGQYRLVLEQRRVLEECFPRCARRWRVVDLADTLPEPGKVDA